jgi:hypothetical protein
VVLPYDLPPQTLGNFCADFRRRCACKHERDMYVSTMLTAVDAEPRSTTSSVRPILSDRDTPDQLFQPALGALSLQAEKV